MGESDERLGTGDSMVTCGVSAGASATGVVLAIRSVNIAVGSMLL